MAAVVPALLLMVLVGGTLLGLTHSTWAINGAVTVTEDVLSTVRAVSDELVGKRGLEGCAVVG